MPLFSLPRPASRTTVDRRKLLLEARMTDREIDVPQATSRAIGRFELVTPPNWTAVIFFACLSFLHLCIAIPAFLKFRWEGYMSAALATFFMTAAFVVYRSKCRIVFDSEQRSIRVRHGVWRFYFQRYISFNDVHAVRLTYSPTDRPRSRIEVLCDNEDIECPPTEVPRQEALCLAMMM